MTENEALEKLRAYHKCQGLQVKGVYEDCNEKLCDNCDLCYAQGNTGEHIKSIEIAIQALEKQIPNKVVKESKWNCFCPCCGKSAYTDCEDGYYNYSLDYCNGCGQKLDWSDEE